ncbi:MAG: efflux RND transporter permease subunit [Rikenellaceae bacterium]
MNIKTFIDRPIFSIGISIFIVIFGLISLVSLPIEQYPNIAPPAVKVSTSYPGASADAIQNSVIAPLEEAINGVENMMYMTSSASNSGDVEITVYFNQGTNADMAAVNVQNRVSIGSGTLPAEVTQIGVTTQKEQPGTLRLVALVSPNGTYDENFLSNYMSINIRPEIQRIQGVAAVTVFGSDYSVRIWLDPKVMNQYKLMPSDISAVLAEQNIEIATGTFGEYSGQTFQYTMKYSGRKQSIEEFEELVIQALPDGEVLRLKDVARIELGRDSYFFNSNINGMNGVPAKINQTAGSNATAINLNIDKLLAELEKQLPPDIEIITFQNTNDFLFASIEAVVISLILAIILVFIVVYFFLQDFRATLIPTICIIISLIGTFAFLMVAGFSLNLLTLFALVLVIGTVVDNAIVVVEAVQARFDSGYKSPYKATVDAMQGLIAALFTTTLVFMAVFIPVSFMGGTTGVFYTQFGLTMAVAVGISFINSLTLSPALCAILLKPNPEEGEGSKVAARVRKAYNTSYNAMLKRYTKGAMFFIRRKILVSFVILASLALLGYMMATTKQGFVPNEDTAMLYIDVSTSQGMTSDETEKSVNEVFEAIKDIPEFKVCARVAGFGLISGRSSNAATFFINLKHWDERPEAENSVEAVMAEIYARTAHIKTARLFVLAPGMIPGYGEGGGFEFHTQNKLGSDIQEFYAVTQDYLAKLNARPEIAMAYSSYNISYPQYVVDVDAVKCKRAGVSPKEVLSVISGYYGSLYASNFNRFSKVYRVMIQAEDSARKDLSTLDDVYVRIGTEMAPVSQFVTLTKVYDPVELNRFNMYPSIGVNGAIAPGYSSGDAINAIKEVADEMPRGYGIDFSGMTREEEQGGDTTMIVFAICFMFIFVLMSMLYESYFIPLAVILSVPFGLLGSFLFAKMMGLENNIYLQVGLIMLIGLLSKTAILLTEYATQCRNSGMSIKQSAFFSAKVRMRPILMTALTMIFGMIPLMFASGVGANGNRTIGSGAVGGMIIGTLALLFIVPALFVIFQTIQEKFKPITEFNDPTDPMIIAEIKAVEEYTKQKQLKKQEQK